MADVSQIKLPNGTTYTLKDDGALQLTGGNVTGPVSFGDSVSIDDLNAGQLVVSGNASFVNTINGNIATASAIKDSNNGNSITVCYSTGGITDPSYYCAWDGYKITYISKANLKSAINTNTTYSAGTGLSLSSTTFSVKLGYTTSGNNRAVQADSNGNLYVTQKDDDTTYSSKAAASGGTDVSLVTTGEKYTWNSKTSNTGTITSVKTTAGAHTTINTTSGAVSFNVPTTAAHVGIKFGYTTSGNNRAVLQDSSGNLYVTQKDDNTTALTSMTGTLGIDHGGTGKTSALAAITNLGGPYLLAQGTEITASSNLDTAYKAMGTYYSGDSTRSGTLAGTVPVTGSGFKMITAIGYRTATLRQFIGGASNDLLYRSSQDTGSTWTKWYKFALLPSGNDNKTFAAVGGSTTPVYINSSGIVTACSYSYLPSSGGTLTGRLTTADPINQIITGSGTAASDKGSGVSPRYFPAKWTFNTGQTATNGDIITIKIPVAGHTYGVFVSIDNGSHYYPVVVGNGTGRLTTHYGNGTPIQLIFDSSGSAADMYALNGADTRDTVTGGVWRVLNYYTDGNTYTQAYCSTAAGTAAKAASMSGYKLTAKRHVMVNITNANTSATALTLNINSTGAKPIYINGSASSTSNHTLPAGSYLVYYDGTNYYFRTDGHLQSTNGILTANTGTITSVKTTAGAHSTVNVTSGAANFNVPTTAAHVGIKFGYTTSGNNRAVLQDSSGNLYVTQKDDNTTYSAMSASELTTGTATTSRVMTAANVKAGVFDLLYPVGSCMTVTSNTNPGTTFGRGTWELVRKFYKSQWLEFTPTWNTSAYTGTQAVAIINDSVIELRFQFSNKVAINDNEVNICTFSPATIGLTSDGEHLIYGPVLGDGVQAIGLGNLTNGTTMVLKTTDWITRPAAYPTTTGQACTMSLVLNVKDECKLDSFCDTFIFKRTA